MNQPVASVLVFNLGSSSLKVARFAPGAALPASRAEIDLGSEHLQGADLLQLALQHLPAAGSPTVVCHRVVHGGRLAGPVNLDDEMLALLDGLGALAPLHQPPALALARACRANWSQARHVAAFDTTWHARLADWSRRLPVPQALHDAGVIRYGFHGLAFQSAMRQLAQADPGLARRRIVLAHLGGGSSLCAVSGGRSVDTTMGMTPMDGLPMATRSGALDPGVVPFMAKQLGMSPAQIDHSLWTKSGLLGIAGSTGDMRQLLASEDPRAALAIAVFVQRVAQGIAAMVTSIGGIDALVFSGGIGNKAAEIRRRVVQLLAWAGLELDNARNRANPTRLDPDGAIVQVWQLTVDEQLELFLAAQETNSTTTSAA